jgi:ABC-2 type transport system permease protein
VLTAYWQRDWRVHLRSPLAITGTLAGPLLLLLAIGVGLGSAIGAGTQQQILTVIVPGLAAMGAILVASQRSVAVFTDRASGLTDEILAGPVNASTIVAAQSIVSAGIATVQGLAVYGMSVALGLASAPAHWVMFLGALLAIALMSSATCTCLALLARRPGTIQALLNLVVNPLFFLSGALFDVDASAPPMRIIALLNPLYYGVRLLQDAYRPGDIDAWASAVSVAVLAGTVVVAIAVGAWSLRRA